MDIMLLQNNLVLSHLQLTVNPSGIDGTVVGNFEHQTVDSISSICTAIVGPSISVPNLEVPELKGPS